MIPTSNRSTYYHPELIEVIIAPQSSNLATTSFENKSTETINNDPTEHEWD